MKNFINIFILSVTFFLATGFARGDTVGLAVDQSVFSFNLNPGEKKDFQISLDNISQNSENIVISAEDFAMGPNNEISAVASQNEQNGMKNWISAAEKNFSIQAGQKKQIAATISIPSDAIVGAHWALLTLESFPAVSGQNFQSTIVGGKIGIYVLVNVGGKVSGQGKVANFRAPIISGGQSNLNVDFENTGNILYVPSGEIQMQNMVTKRTQDLEIEKHFVFPGKQYAFNASWQAPSVFGAYKAQALFVDGDGIAHISQRFVFGKLFFLIPLALGLLGFFARKFFFKRRRKMT